MLGPVEPSFFTLTKALSFPSNAEKVTIVHEKSLLVKLFHFLSCTLLAVSPQAEIYKHNRIRLQHLLFRCYNLTAVNWVQKLMGFANLHVQNSKKKKGLPTDQQKLNGGEREKLQTQKKETFYFLCPFEKYKDRSDKNTQINAFYCCRCFMLISIPFLVFRSDCEHSYRTLLMSSRESYAAFMYKKRYVLLQQFNRHCPYTSMRPLRWLVR